MNPRRFGTFTAVGTVGFYAATGGLVYYGRQRSLFESAVAVAAGSPGITAVAVLVLVGGAVLVRSRN